MCNKHTVSCFDSYPSLRDYARKIKEHNFEALTSLANQSDSKVKWREVNRKEGVERPEKEERRQSNYRIANERNFHENVDQQDRFK